MECSQHCWENYILVWQSLSSVPQIESKGNILMPPRHWYSFQQFHHVPSMFYISTFTFSHLCPFDTEVRWSKNRSHPSRKTCLCSWPFGVPGAVNLRVLEVCWMSTWVARRNRTPMRRTSFDVFVDRRGGSEPWRMGVLCRLRGMNS